MIITKIPGVKLKIETDYTGLGKIQYLLGEMGIRTLDSQYTDHVELDVLVPETMLERVKAELIEGTNGQAKLEEGGKLLVCRRKWRDGNFIEWMWERQCQKKRRERNSDFLESILH